MKFQKKYAEMACSLNNLLDKRLLLLEVRLQLEDVSVATTDCFQFTFVYAFSVKMLIKALFGQHCFHTLWFVWMIGVILREVHLLDNFLAVLQITSMMHLGLFSAWINVHVRYQQGIFCICRMTLWIVDHYQGLISGAMHLFECWYNFLAKLKHIISINYLVRKEQQNKCHLPHKQLTRPVSLVVFAILKCLTGIL